MLDPANAREHGNGDNTFNPLTSGWFWGAMGVVAAGVAATLILATQ
jgi:hypothetical protein